MTERPRDPSSGDANSDASSRPPRDEWPAGVGPDPTTAPTAAGADTTSSVPGWLLENSEAQGSSTLQPRRFLLFGLAVVPWAVVALVLLRPSGSSIAATEPDVEDAPTAASSTPPAPVSAGETPADTLIGASELTAEAPSIDVMGGARTATTIADATAVASLVARDWLGGVGPRPAILDEPLFPEAYVAQLAIEGVDHPAPDHIVVTLLGLVLHTADGGYERAEIVRVAVPVGVDGRGAFPAGRPWRLPPPELTLAIPRSGEIDDPTLIPEAAMALESVGYREVEIERVEATEGWPFIVTTQAVAPHAQTRATHVVWMRMHGSQLVVAGALPPKNLFGDGGRRDAGASPAPTPDPTTHPSPEGKP